MFACRARTSFLTSFICFSSLIFAEEAMENSESCGCGPHHKRLTARHIEGKGVGYNNGYTTVEAFLASDAELGCFVPFLDLRGHVFDNGKFAANAGLGLRWRGDRRIYGVNGFYDYRDDRKSFNQVGLGLEALGKVWDVRINGYLPVGDKTSHPYHTKFGRFAGNSLFVSQKFEFTMKGADAEAGAHFGARDFNFFAGAGPYYFDGQIGPHAWGGKARLMGMWKDYIGLEVSGSYDNVFKGIVQGQLYLSVPLGARTVVKRNKGRCPTSCCTALALDQRMVQPIVRDEIIVLNKHRRDFLAINALTGDPFRFFFVDNTSHSAGTIESPFNTLLDAQNTSGPGDVIYVFPGDSTSTGMSNGITLQNGQQLLGATTSQNITTTLGAVTIPPQSSGTFLPLIANAAGNVVTLASDNVVSGLYIQNLNGNGINGVSVNNMTATQNVIAGSGSSNYGIELIDVSGAAIVTNNTIMFQDSSVDINNSTTSNAMYVIMDNTLNNTGGDYITSVNYGNVSNNTFIFSGNQGISDDYGLYIICTNTSPNLPHTFLVSNNTIHAYDYGIYLQTSETTANLTTTGNTFFTQQDYPIYYDLQPNSNITTNISNNSLTGPYYLVYISNNGSTCSGEIISNTFTVVDDDVAIYLDTSGPASFPDMTISNNTFIAGDYVVDIALGASTPTSSSISILNNSFTASNSYGIQMTSVGADILSANVSGNTFQGFTTNAINVQQTGAGSTCLEFNNNITTPFPNAYLLQQTAGTFNLVTPIGNVGQLTTTGTITPVSSCE